MKGGHTIPANGQQNGGVGPEMKPEVVPGALNIKVSHGANEHDVAVPPDSTFGDLKSVVAQKIGLNPETHKLLFRGKEKEDDEGLQTAGVKDNAKILLMEDVASGQNIPEEVKDTSVISRGGDAVAKVREEVDKLADQVSALQAVVDGGTKVDNKNILYLTEMLMRQLLKLDGIEAEGDGKMQRKTEVRRVQSLVETVDTIKSRNLNPVIDVKETAPATTQWETFEPTSASGGNPPPAPAPAPVPDPAPAISPTTTPILNPNHSPLSSHAPYAAPSSLHAPYTAPLPLHSPYAAPLPLHAPYPDPMSLHSPYAAPLPLHAPYAAPLPLHAPYAEPVSLHLPYAAPLLSHSPFMAPYETQLSSHVPVPSPSAPNPTLTPSPHPLYSHGPYAAPFPPYAFAPATTTTAAPVASFVPAPMSSTTKVSQDWENFD